MATFLTSRQVAERWECSPRQVQRLCASGGLRAMQLGVQSWRIALADVEAYERAHTTAATDVAKAPAPAPASREEVRPPVSIDGFALPDGYEPVFPDLWGV